MSTTSTRENGHANQVANFSLAIEKLEALDPAYDPYPPELQIAALRDTLLLAEESLDTVSSDESFITDKVNEAQEVYKALPLLATTVIDGLIGCKAPKALIKDARAISAKLRSPKPMKDTAVSGDILTDPTSDTGETVDVKSISRSQLGRDQKARHFTKLVALAATQPGYLPKEDWLRIDSLKAHRDYLVRINKDLDALATNVSKSRLIRNQILYGPDFGIYDLSVAFKHYVRSLVGGKDPRFTQISKIRFKKR